MTMYKKFIIEDEFARNMFSRANVDFSMGEATSEGVNESELIFQNRVLFDQKYGH